MASVKRYVVWPPKIKHVVPLGHLYDVEQSDINQESGNSYPRDGGRSTELPGGNALIQFNDTFCHNAAGQFLGVSENNVALCTNFDSPTRSRYLAPEGSNNIDITERQIPVLVGRFPDEADTKKERACIWTFGGIVWYLITDGAAYGWNFFEKHNVKFGNVFSDRVEWVGIASISVDWRAGTPKVEAERESLSGGRILFSGAEPRLGTFSSHTDGTYMYAYGHHGSDYSGNHDIVLGRVPIDSAKARIHWRFWGGEGKGWCEDWKEAAPVLHNYQHGQIFPTKLFGEESPYRYGFVGCTHTGDSKVMFGRARRAWGPFEIVELMTAHPLGKTSDLGFTYCMYAHPWAFPQSKGDLMITWSEGGMTGGVVAVKVRFETGIGLMQPQDGMGPIQQSVFDEDDQNEPQSRQEVNKLNVQERTGDQNASRGDGGKKNTFGKAAGALFRRLGKENK
ncbi:splicing factor u2af 35 kda subunit protein [Rutstroemia sp. NJR-2017a BVV2]|nr:splicing factor u2af 35 kda subunit protein [Rutstroemia sp. NJR-2017a BVV2]